MIKYYIFLILLVIYFPTAASSNVKNNINHQESVEDAYESSMRSHCIKELELNLTQLQKNGTVNYYWIAYNKLFQTLYYIHNKDTRKARQQAKDGINILQSRKELNSEGYALLSYIQCIYIQFTSGLESGVFSRKSLANAHKSLKLNPKNPRGWYILGLLDYYTPMKMGGGSQCEKYLLKAISIKPNKTIPSWGRIEAYTLLITYYMKSKKKSQADKLKKEALLEFPKEKSFMD